jgi:hypothetical protein
VGECQPCKLVASSACSCPQGSKAAAKDSKAVCKHVFYVLVAYARDPLSFDAASPTAPAPPQLDAAASLMPVLQPPPRARSLPSSFVDTRQAQPAPKPEGPSAASASAAVAAVRRRDPPRDAPRDAQRVVIDLRGSPPPADASDVSRAAGPRRSAAGPKDSRVEAVPEPKAPISLDAPYPRTTGTFLLDFATEVIKQAKRAKLAGATGAPTAKLNASEDGPTALRGAATSGLDQGAMPAPAEEVRARPTLSTTEAAASIPKPKPNPYFGLM